MSSNEKRARQAPIVVALKRMFSSKGEPNDARRRKTSMQFLGLLCLLLAGLFAYSDFIIASIWFGIGTVSLARSVAEKQSIVKIPQSEGSASL